MKTDTILNRAFRKLFGDPLVRESLIVAENEYYIKRIVNLNAVNRHLEAGNWFAELIEVLLSYWKKDPQNPLYLHLLSMAAKDTGFANRCASIIQLAISKISGKNMDFTQVFLDLGMLYRVSGKTSAEELDCYIKSVNSVPPENGCFAATRKLKSEACYRAYIIAKEIGLAEQANYYFKKAELLSDGIKLQYDFASKVFYSDDLGLMTPELIARVNSRIEGFDVLG